MTRNIFILLMSFSMAAAGKPEKKDPLALEASFHSEIESTLSGLGLGPCRKLKIKTWNDLCEGVCMVQSACANDYTLDLSYRGDGKGKATLFSISLLSNPGTKNFITADAVQKLTEALVAKLEKRFHLTCKAGAQSSDALRYRGYACGTHQIEATAPDNIKKDFILTLELI